MLALSPPRLRASAVWICAMVTCIAISVTGVARPPEQVEAQTIGGRLFKLMSGGGGTVTLTWATGTGQTGYRLNRITGTGVFVVGTPAGTAISFTDTLGSTTGVACYQLEILDGTNVVGRSEVLCVIFTGGGTQPVRNLAIQTNESARSLISWQAPATAGPAILGYLVIPLGRIPLPLIPAGTTQALDVPLGLTCYIVLTLIPDSAQVPFQVGGYSDITCASNGQANGPGISGTPTVTSTQTATMVLATATPSVIPTQTTVTGQVTVVINEIESNGGTPGDWVELFNPGPAPVNLAGFVFRDNDDTHTYTIPAGTTIASGEYSILEEAALSFGLGSGDSARLFAPGGSTLVDSFVWTAHAATTYGRCPNGSGAFTTTASSTKGTANDCGSPSPTIGPSQTVVPAPFATPWPGSPDVQTVDGSNVLGGNMSGLTYEPSGSAAPGVLWAARNGPGTLFRLIWNGTTWTPDPSNDWGAGKALRYPNGTGNPDAEGVTFAATVDGGLYVATERNNDANSVSRNSILRFNAAAVGPTLTATHEWNLTGDLPAVGSNLGLETITWIPDAFLTARGFFDENKGHAYLPAEYPDHGDGLFFVGVEANGIIYAYALNHADTTFTRIAAITSGFTGVMGLEFDRELSYLWAVCDDTCGGRSAVLEMTGQGRFAVTRVFERPASMPNLNNEGFAVAPQAECANNLKPAYWADDAATGGNAIRRGSLACSTF
jgi:hypothetical protein